MSMSVALTLTLRDMLSAPARAALEAVRASAQRTGAGMGQINAGADAARSSMYRLSTSAQSALDMIRGRARTAASGVDAVGQSSARAAVEAGRLAREAGEVARQRVDGLRASIDQAAQSGRTARTALSSVREAGDRVGGIRLDGPVHQLEQVAQRASAARRALEAVANAGRGVSAGVAGVTAGAAVATRAAEKPLAYDDRVTQIAKTAYADTDTTAGQRKAAKESINAGVMRATRDGGGSRDGAAEALSELMSSNIYKLDDALAILPTLQKYATAGDAAPVDMAKIAIASRQNMGVAPEDVEKALGFALAGGQAGSMELRDMAKWLPQQMAAASTAGMSGLAGVRRLVLSNEMVASTAGTKDEAGNNLVNFLMKINSADTAKDFEKIKIGGKPVKLSQRLAAGREKGAQSIDTFLEMVDEVAAQDKGYQRVKERQKNAKNSTELAAALKDEEKILEAAGVFKIVQDRQALMALIGERANPQRKAEIEKALDNSGTALPRAQAWDRENLSQKVQAAANEKDNAATRALGEVEGPLGKMLGVLSDTAEAYPKLTTGAYAAATALGVLAAAAGAAGLTSRILQRGAGAPRVPTPAPAPGAPAPAGGRAPAPAAPPPPPAAPKPGAPVPSPAAGAQPKLPTPPAPNNMHGLHEAARQAPGALPAELTASRGRQAYWDTVRQEAARGAAVRADVAVQQSRVGSVLDAARAQPLGKANVALAAGMGVYTAWQIEQQHLPQRQRVVEHAKNAGGVVGGVAGGWAGAAAGAAAGAPLAPFTFGLSVPVGAALGGIGGGIGGGMGGQRIIELLTELLAEQKKPPPPPPPPPPVQITNNMVVDGSVVTSVVNDINAREVRRAH